jgi:AcrR family transcriptional regulator
MSEEPEKPRNRKSKAEQRAETYEEILDAAEYLFSKGGWHGVTLRDVARRVGVHVSLLHYYFKHKQTLFEAVFARRVHVSVERRMKALDAYEAETGDHPTAEGALRAFLDVDLELYMESGEPWLNYAGFVASVSNTPEGAALMDKHFDPIVLRLISILKRAMPDVPEERIFWGYHFITGALLNTLARTGRIDRLSDGLCRSDDVKALKQHMSTFMAGGLDALRRG